MSKLPAACVPAWILVRRVVTLTALLALAAGCASQRAATTPFDRPFVFHRDTFAYPNELYWVYQIDPKTGEMTHEWREPKPTYAQHCFVVARSARQFFQHARFDPTQPTVDDDKYRELIRKVVDVDPRHELDSEEKIVIPGFPDLYVFSVSRENLLKDECGSAWESYFQRGHWRMIWHFSKKGQMKMACQLVDSIGRNRPPVVHVAHFPKLEINHALLLYAVKEGESEIEFTAYDPNYPSQPTSLYFRKAEQRFYYPPQTYFAGGIVDVYEIYYRWNY